MTTECGASVVLWPDYEAIDLHCRLPEGHQGRHYDPELNDTWEGDDPDSAESATTHPPSEEVEDR